MKKKRTIVSLARGVRPELREKGIKIDKAGRARRGGKFLTLAAVARAVTSLKKTAKRRPTRRPPAVPVRETTRERQMRQRAERAEKLLTAREQKLAAQEQKIAAQKEQMRALRARQKRAAAKAKREAQAREKARRAEAKAEREEKKRRTKQVTALEAQRAQAQKRLEEVAKAVPLPLPLPSPEPEPEPEPEKKPRKGKKPKKPKKPKPPVELPEGDAAILASWNLLTDEQQQITRVSLTPAGKKELERRQREEFERRKQAAKPGAPPVVAAKLPEELRDDLINAIKRKGAKKAIAEEVNNAIVRKKPVPAWEEQHRATMRHPNMIVQTDKEAIKAANKGAYPKRERKGTRYHATIVCVTQHPPLQKYGPTTIDGFEDLFVMYVSAQGATSRAGIKQNIARAIREVLMQVPGGAPIFVAAIEVRTSRKKEK